MSYPNSGGRTATEPVVRDQVAAALVDKGMGLRQLGRRDEEGGADDRVVPGVGRIPRAALGPLLL